MLVDASRNYFELSSLRKIVLYLEKFKLNILHLRLTDDHGFMVKLRSHPELAVPTTEGGKVYTPEQLSDLQKYAERHNVILIPEIGVPGHAAAWFKSGLVLECPSVACSRAWSVPLDVSKKETVDLVVDVVKEVVKIFRNPPFIHLGGDELAGSSTCFREAGVSSNRDEFEASLSKRLATELGEIKIIRWEESANYSPDLVHLWKTNRHTGKQQVLISTGLYWDKGESDVWKVYKNTRALLKHQPYGVVATAWELDWDAWKERNVWGNLAAYSIAMSGDHDLDETNFLERYKVICAEIAAKNALFGDAKCYIPLTMDGFAPRFHFRENERDALLCQRISRGTMSCTTKNCKSYGRMSHPGYKQVKEFRV